MGMATVLDLYNEVNCALKHFYRRLSLALKEHKKPYLYRTESNTRRCARSPRVNFVHVAHKLVLTVIYADT